MPGIFVSRNFVGGNEEITGEGEREIPGGEFLPQGISTTGNSSAETSPPRPPPTIPPPAPAGVPPKTRPPKFPPGWEKNLSYAKKVADIFAAEGISLHLKAATFPPAHLPEGIDPTDKNRERPPIGCREIIHSSRIRLPVTKEEIAKAEFAREQGRKVFEPRGKFAECVSWVKLGAKLSWGWYW